MFSCSTTKSLWWEVQNWVSRVGPFPTDPINHFIQFSHWNSKRHIVKRWEVLWIALSMTIWKHRNSVVFNNQIFSPEKVMDEALFHTWSWLKCMDKDFDMHFNQWSSNLKEQLSQGGYVSVVFAFVSIFMLVGLGNLPCIFVSYFQYTQY